MEKKALEKITRDVLNEELDDIIYNLRVAANKIQRLSTKLKMDNDLGMRADQLTIDADVAFSNRIARLGLDKYDDCEDVSGDLNLNEANQKKKMNIFYEKKNTQKAQGDL